MLNLLKKILSGARQINDRLQNLTAAQKFYRDLVNAAKVLVRLCQAIAIAGLPGAELHDQISAQQEIRDGTEPPLKPALSAGLPFVTRSMSRPPFRSRFISVEIPSLFK